MHVGMVFVDEVARVRARACGCPSCRFGARGMFVGDDDFSCRRFVVWWMSLVDVSFMCFNLSFVWMLEMNVDVSCGCRTMLIDCTHNV